MPSDVTIVVDGGEVQVFELVSTAHRPSGGRLAVDDPIAPLLVGHSPSDGATLGPNAGHRWLSSKGDRSLD